MTNPISSVEFSQSLEILAQKKPLDSANFQAMLLAIMHGTIEPPQIAAFLMALRIKGETPEEITVAAQVMRQMMTRVVLPPELLARAIDNCGTGGDHSGLFNVSTAAAFVIAAAGGIVAKHGNRSVSSSTGSADVLMAAGANLDLNAEQVAICIQEMGIGFMFAPNFHPAMRHVAPVRRSLGVRTMFNLLGPLANPAGVRRQVLGVFDAQWLQPMTEALQRLGSTHVWTVRSEDGLDELSPFANNNIVELKNKFIQNINIKNNNFNSLTKNIHTQLSILKVNTAQESLNIIHQIFSNNSEINRQKITENAKKMVIINAAAGLYIGGVAESFSAGIALAESAIHSGNALKKWHDFMSFTQKISK